MLVTHRFAKLFAQFTVGWPVITDNRGSGQNMLTNQRIQRFLCTVWNTKCKHQTTSASLDSSKDPLSCPLFWLATMMFLFRNCGLVDLNVFSRSTKLLLIEAITI
jgi:hypothetical protein